MLDNAKSCACWIKIVPLSPIVHSGANRRGSELRIGYVNKIFWEHGIGHVSPCDNSLLGFLKETVAQQHTNCWRPSASSETTFKHVKPQMLQRMPHRTWCRIILCCENDGELVRFVSYVVQCVIRLWHFYGE